MPGFCDGIKLALVFELLGELVIEVLCHLRMVPHEFCSFMEAQGAKALTISEEISEGIGCNREATKVSLIPGLDFRVGAVFVHAVDVSAWLKLQKSASWVGWTPGVF